MRLSFNLPFHISPSPPPAAPAVGRLSDGLCQEVPLGDAQTRIVFELRLLQRRPTHLPTAHSLHASSRDDAQEYKIVRLSLPRLRGTHHATVIRSRAFLRHKELPFASANGIPYQRGAFDPKNTVRLFGDSTRLTDDSIRSYMMTDRVTFLLLLPKKHGYSFRGRPYEKLPGRKLARSHKRSPRTRRPCTPRAVIQPFGIHRVQNVVLSFPSEKSTKWPADPHQDHPAGLILWGRGGNEVTAWQCPVDPDRQGFFFLVSLDRGTNSRLETLGLLNLSVTSPPLALE
ncbi:hypothetical protein BDP67DRAFT_57122 [Colletotrichum lupini]|nr:hypothetical protein BDP67DRAFT_57122 [Colletotrichum lupini]